MDEDETQQHVMETCKMLHTKEETKIYDQDLYTEDINHLRSTVKKIDNLLKWIKQAQVPVANHYRTPCTKEEEEEEEQEQEEEEEEEEEEPGSSTRVHLYLA